MTASALLLLAGLAVTALGVMNLAASGGDQAGPLDVVVISALFFPLGLALLVGGMRLATPTRGRRGAVDRAR